MGKTIREPRSTEKVVKESTLKTPKQKIKTIYKKVKEKFLTEAQKEYWDILENNEITFCSGPSGTGKSFIAIKKALDLLWDDKNHYNKIILIRPAVESDDRSLGALPGDLDQKMDPYVKPSLYIMNKIIGVDSTVKLKESGFIEIHSFNYLRGWTIDNAIVILEESQNTTVKQMKLFLTRIGFNSKFFVSGDLEQSDNFKDFSKCGLFDAKERLKDVNGVGFFEFKDTDIVRNPIISEILKRYN